MPHDFPRLDNEIVLKYFIKHLQNGNPLSYSELISYVKQRKLNVTNKFIRNIRKEVFASAIFTPIKKIKKYQTITLPKLSLCSTDYAEYRKDLKSYNDNNVGFSLINCVITQRRWATPLVSKTKESFETSIENAVRGNVFPAIRTVLTDRESALISDEFQQRMKDKFGIRFHFLHRYSKAWSSEIAIRDIKTKLSMALISNNSKRWVDSLQKIITSFNKEKVPGTQFRRIDIDDSNFFEFLDELYDLKDATLSFNTRSLNMNSLSPGWQNKLFKFKLNEEVFVSRSSLKEKNTFEKTSMTGGFSKKIYIIVDAFLRSTNDDQLVPGMFF